MTSWSASSRRNFVAVSAGLASTSITGVSSVLADYRPAVRPLSYRVDSTIPPTLLSVTPGQAQGILAALGRGSGTDKEAIVVDTLNLNNMLNRAVFGTINTVSSFADGSASASSKAWTTSFCCLAMPSTPQPTDVALAQELLESMVKARGKEKGSTGLGLYFCPYSTQSSLNQYTSGQVDEAALSQALTEAGVSSTTQELYAPILQFAKDKSLDLIAMAPEVEDMITVRAKGLQNVNAQRRAQYVVDAPGFVALPNDPRFKLYTDRSLTKAFVPESPSDNNVANFYAQKIMAHEAGATALAQYAVERPGSFVTAVASVADLRYMGGVNGRLPRICRALQPDCGVTSNAVTTILLNPTAEDTLSKSRFLRLEIGTAPDTLDYQTKVADYIWFSSAPKVNLIPRLMN